MFDLGVRFFTFPESDFVSSCTAPLEDFWTDLFQKMDRHIFGGRIGIELIDTVWLGGPNRLQRVLVFSPQHKRVVPMLVQPAVDPLLEQFEIENSPNFVLRLTGNVNLKDIIVAVKVLTFPFVPEQAMARTKGETTHDTEWHVWTTSPCETTIELLVRTVAYQSVQQHEPIPRNHFRPAPFRIPR